MKATADLEIGCATEAVGKELWSVLAPDNEGGPRGLRIKMGVRGRVLWVSIESETSVNGISTALSFLRDIALFQEIRLLSAVKEARPRA